jgi:hypothetical protein
MISNRGFGTILQASQKVEIRLGNLHVLQSRCKDFMLLKYVRTKIDNVHRKNPILEQLKEKIIVFIVCIVNAKLLENMQSIY